MSEERNKNLSASLLHMSRVLMACNEKKKKCTCAIEVSYRDDPNLSEVERYQANLVCRSNSPPPPANQNWKRDFQYMMPRPS